MKGGWSMNYLNTPLNNFVNDGTDEKLVKSAMAMAMPVQVTVHGKHGDYRAIRYKKTQESKAPTKPEKSRFAEGKDLTSNINPSYSYMAFDNSQTYTLEHIVHKYHGSEFLRKKYKSLNSFIKECYFVSTGRNTTADCYRKSNGEYQSRRVKQVHDRIIRDICNEGDKPPKDVKPVCFLYGGGSGSGKSSVVSVAVEPSIQKTGLKFAQVDCDSIKAKLPEHAMFFEQDPDSTAFREHKESSDICKKTIDALIEQGRCFCYDGTMSDFEKYKGIVSKLRKKGYEIHIVATDVPVETAIERGKARERQIPDYIFQKTHKGFAEAFPEISELDVDSVSLYDNSQPFGESPTLVMSNDGGIRNKELWDRFLRKGNHEELIYEESKGE